MYNHQNTGLVYSHTFETQRVYDFATQNKIGKTGAEAIDHWLKLLGYEIEDVSENKQYQKIDVDRLLIRPDSSITKAEYKTDLKAKQTGNLFFEHLSVEHRNIPGWGWKSQADLWIFYIPSQEILAVNPGKMRYLITETLPNLTKKTIPNQGYNSTGYPIPLTDVREIALHVYQLPKMLF